LVQASLHTEQETLPPRHVAIIMDGNGRWAKARGLPRVAGHRRGAEAVRRVVEACREIQVPYLTLYAFSSENWKRSPTEIDDLMGLLRHYLRRELEDLHANNVRVRFIGNWRALAKDIVDLISTTIDKTAENTGLTFVIAVNYGSRNEVLDAVRHIAADVSTGRIQIDEIDEAMFAGYLHTGEIPDPDLIIRTSGEQRLSNFLLWQAAYAELIFMDLMWPDFNKDSLLNAVAEFRGRERRYGGRDG
jgi:undecaprenyl diphosphate synthase